MQFADQFIWLYTFINIFILFIYLVIVCVWLILAAILNPTAFLPYAASAATFATYC